VDNDANVAALAEAHDEALELVVRHLVMFTVGTGVGGGLVLGGRIYRGATGAAGELGHTILGLDLAGAVPAPMGFPQPGSLEFVIAGHALDRLAALAGRARPKSALARSRAEGTPALRARAIAAAVGGGARPWRAGARRRGLESGQLDWQPGTLDREDGHEPLLVLGVDAGDHLDVLLQAGAPQLRGEQLVDLEQARGVVHRDLDAHGALDPRTEDDLVDGGC